MTRIDVRIRRAVPAAIAPAAVALLLTVGGAVAQSPAPSAPPPTPAPTVFDESGIDWPPMQFVGSDPAGQLTFTSSCGIWGRDEIALSGEGSAGSTELVVSFHEYDQGASQWFGTVSGTFTGTNGITVAVGPEGALIYYDFDLGQWTLVAGWAAQIKATACVLPSPVPSTPA